MMLRNPSFHWWIEAEVDRTREQEDWRFDMSLERFHQKAISRFHDETVSQAPGGRECAHDFRTSIIICFAMQVRLIDKTPPPDHIDIVMLEVDRVLYKLLANKAGVQDFLDEVFEIRTSLSEAQLLTWNRWARLVQDWESGLPSEANRRSLLDTRDHDLFGVRDRVPVRSATQSRLQARLRERSAAASGASNLSSGGSNSPESRTSSQSVPRHGSAPIAQRRDPGRMASSSSSADEAGRKKGPVSEAELAAKEKALSDLVSQIYLDTGSRKKSKRTERRPRDSRAATSRRPARSQSPRAPAAPPPIPTSPQSSPRTAAWEADFTSTCRSATAKVNSSRAKIENSEHWMPLSQAPPEIQQGIHRMRRQTEPVHKDTMHQFFPGSDAARAVPRSTIAAMGALEALHEADVRLVEAQMLRNATGREPRGTEEQEKARVARERSDLVRLPSRPSKA